MRAAPEGSSARPRPGQRLRHGTRLFRILSVALRDPQGRFLTCTCEEETAP
ncbi:phage head completion protein [Litorisediminicola beolgyonensis]|uniref:Head-tail adaptor protein n=1 Tax=Litorisediminicola beolgyonensis TaxID=1173614 RepID=A0ABW3ZNR5_9RHOB